MSEFSNMRGQTLIDTAQALMADGKGLLAMDESNPTCNKRFAKQCLEVAPQYVGRHGV